MAAMTVAELHRLFYGAPPRRSETQRIERVETAVPQVEKSVGINATYRLLRWGDEWIKGQGRRATVEPGGKVRFKAGLFLPTAEVEDGWRIFEPVERSDWERDNGFGFVSMREEDWQRLLAKACQASLKEVEP